MTWGAGPLQVAGRKQSPLGADAALAAGKLDFGPQGQEYVNVAFTTNAGTVQNVGVEIDTASWTNTAFSAAAPWMAVTATGSNDLIQIGFLAETTSNGGPGVYAVQVGGPITVSVEGTASIAAGARFVQGATAGVFTNTAAGQSQATATNDILNRFQVPLLIAHQSRATSAASATFGMILIPPRLKHDAIPG